MTTPPRHNRQPLTAGRVLAAGAALALLTGCGGDAMVPVRGVVKYADGSPVSGAKRVVQFVPIESDASVIRGATGTIRDDGSFEMTTKKPGDGVYRGAYNVAFAIETAPYEGQSLIPKRYTAEGTGDWPFPAVVVDGSIDDLEFVLERE